MAVKDYLNGTNTLPTLVKPLAPTTGNPMQVGPSDLTGAPITAPAPTVAPSPTQGLTGNTAGDFTYQSTLNDIFKNTSLLDSQSQLEADRAKSDTQGLYEQAAKAYGMAAKHSKNSFAGKGMLYSSAYLQDQGDVAAANQENVGNITSAAQRYFEDLTRQTAQRKMDTENAKLAAEQAQANIRAQQDLQRALIEAQNKAYADLTASLTSTGVTGADGGYANSTPVQVSGPNTEYLGSLSPDQLYWWTYNNVGREAADALRS